MQWSQDHHSLPHCRTPCLIITSPLKFDKIHVNGMTDFLHNVNYNANVFSAEC